MLENKSESAAMTTPHNIRGRGSNLAERETRGTFKCYQFAQGMCFVHSFLYLLQAIQYLFLNSITNLSVRFLISFLRV